MVEGGETKRGGLPGLNLACRFVKDLPRSLSEVPNKLGSTRSQAPAHVLPESLARARLLKGL